MGPHIRSDEISYDVPLENTYDLMPSIDSDLVGDRMVDLMRGLDVELISCFV